MLYSEILFALCHHENTSGHTSLTQTTYKQSLWLNENVFLPVPILFCSQTGTCYLRAVIIFPLEIMQNIYCKLPYTLTKGQSWALKPLLVSHNEHSPLSEIKRPEHSSVLPYRSEAMIYLQTKGLREQGKL